MSKHRTRIAWTENETRRLVRHLIENGAHEGMKGAEFLEKLRAAQTELLPAYRRRQVKSRSQFKLLEQELRYQLTVKANAPQDPEESLVQEQQEAPPEPAPDVEPLVQEPPPASLAASLDLILEVEAEKIARRFVYHLRRAFERISNEEVETFLYEKPKTDKKPRAVVVGLLPGQETLMQVEFGEHLDLRFIPSDKRAPAAIATAQEADKIVGMISFLPHALDGALAKHYPNTYRRCTGGLDQLRTHLRALIGPNDGMEPT